MSVVTEAIDQGRRRLRIHEADMTDRLMREYEVVSRHLDRQLAVLQAQIDLAIARGEPVSEAWLYRQRWWQEVQDSIDVEMARFSNQAAGIITTTQAGAVTIAVESTLPIARAAGNPFQGRVYGQAFERWVSATVPGSPIRQVVDGYGTRVSESIMKHMTEGLGSGKNPRTIARNIMREVGDEAVEYRIATLTRTETMRTFRGASADTMEPLRQQGVVTGYVWLASLSSRTCAACLAMHGTFSEEYPVLQHPNCRCVARAITDPAIIPGGGWHGQTGEEWLRKQPVNVQQRVLLAPGRYEAFQAGVPLSAMTTIRHDAVWGDSIGIKPMRDMKDLEAAA